MLRTKGDRSVLEGLDQAYELLYGADPLEFVPIDGALVRRFLRKRGIELSAFSLSPEPE